MEDEAERGRPHEVRSFDGQHCTSLAFFNSIAVDAFRCSAFFLLASGRYEQIWHTVSTSA